MTSLKQQKGVIDPISIIAGLFLVVTLIVGTVVVNDRDFSLNTAEKASTTGNSCFDECRKEKGRVYCNNLCGINVNWEGEDLTPTATTPPTQSNLTEEQIREKSQCLQEGGFWLSNNTCSYTQQTEAITQISQQIQNNNNNQQQETENNNTYCNVSIKNSFCGTGGNCPSGYYCQVWVKSNCDQEIRVTANTCTVSSTEVNIDTKECQPSSKECDGNTLKTCSQNGFWVSQNCQYGCLNKACISSVSTSVEVNRDDEGTTRDLTVILRDENQDVITANTAPITINTQSPTIEKTDDGFIKTVTTVINNADTGEIINAITQNIASIKKTNGDYCSYDGECNSGKCDFAGTPVRRCVPNVTQLEMAYNGLETLTFGTFGDYVNAYSPDKVQYYWQANGYSSLSDCQNSMAGRGKGYCSQISYSKDQLASSTMLGTVITSEVALLGTGFGFASGALTGTQALYQGLAISSLYQTGSAVDICNTNPDSIECRDAKIWAAISWINVGTAANLVNNATQTAKLLNTGVNILNLAGDVAIDVNYNCFGENKNDLGCVLAAGATVLDFAGGAADLIDIIKPTKVAQAISPLPDTHVEVGVDPLTDIYKGTIPSDIPDGTMGFSNNFLTNNPPTVSPIDGLVNALEASGVNLSFPDVTIKNWGNNLADTIAHSPLTGDISVTTLDTAILPNGSPTNLDNVMAQAGAGNIPPTMVIPDTPNISANPPLLTQIENWANNNIPWIFGSGSPSVSPLAGVTTNIKPEKLILTETTSQTLAEAVKGIDPNDAINIDRKLYQEGSALHIYSPEKNIKIALENVPDPIDIIKTVNSNTPEEALDKIKKILADKGVIIVEDPLDPKYKNLILSDDLYNKNINDSTQNFAAYVTDGYIRITDEAGNEFVFIPSDRKVTSYIFLHPEFNTLPIGQRIKTLVHESGHYIEEVVLDGAIENIEGIDGLVKPATEYISTLYGTHAALSTSDPTSAGLVQQLKLNAQVLGYPDEYLNIAQPNWFQQNIYSSTDEFLPAVKTWWDDSPINWQKQGGNNTPKTMVKFSENESTDKLVKFIVGDEVTKAEDLALKIQNDQQAIINEYSLPSYTTRFNNPQQYLAELLKIADEKGIIIKVDPATKHIYHDSGVITLRTIESYSDSDLKKLVHELTHALDFKSKKVFSPEQSEYRAYIVDLGDAVAVEKALGDNFVDFLFGGFGVKGSVEKYYKDIGVNDMPWLNNNISIPEKNIPFIQRVKDWFDDTFGGIGGSGSPSVSPFVSDTSTVIDDPITGGIIKNPLPQSEIPIKTGGRLGGYTNYQEYLDFNFNAPASFYEEFGGQAGIPKIISRTAEGGYVIERVNGIKLEDFNGKLTQEEITLAVDKLREQQKLTGYAHGDITNSNILIESLPDGSHKINFIDYRGKLDEYKTEEWKQISISDLQEELNKFITNNTKSGQVLVEFSAAMPVVMAIPAAGLYFADQYFDLGIVDAMTSSINEALEPTQNKSSNITDPVYDTVNFWANTASIIYAINNDKELSEIAINNPDQRPYDEIIQEAIDNYTANNPGSDIYYSPNPNALSLTDIFKQTFNKDSLEIISTTLADEEFKKLSLSGKIMKLSNNLLTDRNTFIDSVVGAAGNIGLFTKDGGTYPIIGFENEVVNLTAIIESEVENTGNPVSHSFVIEYFLDKNNGDLSQAILDSSNFEEFLTRSLDGEIVDDPYVWIQNHILDEYSPILPYHVLSTNEEVLENSQIYYDYSLPNRLGQVYHAANISALLNYLPPEVIRAMVIGEYLSYGEKHGLIKMSADLEILKRLDQINDLLKSYEQPTN